MAAFLLATASPRTSVSSVSCSIRYKSEGSRASVDIFVPPEQVIDTVDLYFLKARQRRLSLKFLSWFVLHHNIQMDTHDSIEDARSTLMLYKAYQEFEEMNIFDQKLEDLYRAGRQYVSATQVQRSLAQFACQNWKPPPPDGATSSTPQPHQGNESPAPHLPHFAMDYGKMVQQPQNLSQGSYSAGHATPPGPTFAPPSNGNTHSWRIRR